MKRKRDDEEGAGPLNACSFCGKDTTPVFVRDGRHFIIRGGSPQYVLLLHATRWSRHEMLCYDGGVWWMRSLETGESWRRCHWWMKPHLDCEDGKEYPWSILLSQCGECAVKETIWQDAYATIGDLRAEWERVPFEDEKARVAVEARVHGYCSYCGELIMTSETKRQPFRGLTKPLDELTFCRGVWWMSAHGVDHWRRCH